MTGWRKPEAQIQQQFGRLEAACQREGIPATVQRRIIYKALTERADHPTVDQVYAAVKEHLPGVSRTTVYRTLEKFAELGLARRTHHFAASARFDGNTEQHHHLVCTSCGKVGDFQDQDLRVHGLAVERCNGFSVEDYSIYFEGLCAGCMKPRASRSKPKSRAGEGRAKKTSQRGTNRDD
jgi:Fur family transcriptional regulator, peroxide stress response regulator